MPTKYPHHYGRQFESYIKQFLRIFSGFQVRDGVDRDGDGENDLRSVPVYYGNATRIVSSVLNKRKSFTNPVIPLMAGFLQSIEINQDRRMPNMYHRDVISYKDSDGNLQRTERMMGPVVNLNLGLSIYGSSYDEVMQLLEQILLVFNPKVTIQKSEDLLDQNYISQVELESIDPEINMPLSTEERTMVTTLNFRTEVRLNYPHILTNEEMIEKITANIYDDTVEVQNIESLEITD